MENRRDPRQSSVDSATPRTHSSVSTFATRQGPRTENNRETPAQDDSVVTEARGNHSLSPTETRNKQSRVPRQKRNSRMYAATSAKQTCIQVYTARKASPPENHRNQHRATDPYILRGSYSVGNDPFARIIRCRSLPRNANLVVLKWKTHYQNGPNSDSSLFSHYYSCEQELQLRELLLFNKDQERGMMLHQPGERLHAIQQACDEHNVPLIVALSLRRHCIKWNYPDLRMQDLGLGRDEMIRQSAEHFERAVGEYLRRHNVRYYNEATQKRINKSHRPFPPTPDFLLHHPAGLRRCIGDGEHEMHQIHWIEAKMYYGASTVPWDDSRTANGTILPTAEKYTRVFGPGAMIFMHGCGRDLAERLLDLGVVALDGSTGSLNLRKVYAHQRKWCANADGDILP